MNYKKLILKGSFCFAAVLAGTASAAFPERPIEIVVPFSPGGGTDAITRTIAENISKNLKQPVIVVNKPGAGTVIGTGFVAKSKPDGHTLLMASFAHAVNPELYKDLPYSTNNDFTPVAFVGASPNILLVNSESPHKTVQDLINFAKANPDTLTFGSYGTGTSAHLMGELFENLAGIKMTHVPYKGGGPATTALLGKEIDMVFGAAGVSQHIDSGRLRAIAVTTGERSASFPNVPTIAESGLPAYKADSWYGLFAPTGTPQDVVEKLNGAVAVAVESAEFQKRAKQEGLSIRVGSPKDLGDYLTKTQALWQKVVKDAQIKIE